MPELFLGIDVGTQGVRAIAVDARGTQHAAASAPFAAANKVAAAAPAQDGASEQDPAQWWSATQACLAALLGDLRAAGFAAGDIAAVAVDGTSGTLLAVDAVGAPLGPAVMYNDARSAGVVPEVRAAGRALEAKLGYAFGSSFGLPKLVWMCRRDPSLTQRAAHFAHAADFIAGQLCGDFAVTDHNNALKTGFDLIAYRWPEFIERELGIPMAKLPRVVRPGEVIGAVSARAARATGLSPRTRVVAGTTDGTAAQLASGAAGEGEWNSVLGTTLVIKGIARDLIKDPLGRVYCHLHPDRDGGWMPGGASNTGAEWIALGFPGRDPAELDAQAAPLLPTGLISYPLARRGERFPFVDPNAEGFMVGVPASDLERYAANLEGLAYVERMAYDVVHALGAPVGDAIHVTGGGARSTTWLKVRASVLGKQLIRPAISETAMGAAILAASRTAHAGVAAAARAMVMIAARVDPEPAWETRYADNYARFVARTERLRHSAQ